MADRDFAATPVVPLDVEQTAILASLEAAYALPAYQDEQDDRIGPQLVEEAREMQPEGLLLNAPRPSLLRFMPALNVTREEIDQMIGMLRTLLKKLA